MDSFYAIQDLNTGEYLTDGGKWGWDQKWIGIFGWTKNIKEVKKFTSDISAIVYISEELTYKLNEDIEPGDDYSDRMLHVDVTIIKIFSV